MRRPSDLPRRRAFGRLSGRVLVIVVIVLFLALIVFGRAMARFYVDYLWHDSLGRSDVFWGVLRTKLWLFLAFLAAFVALAGVNLYIADRTAPRAFPANVHPYVERFHEVFGHRLRLVRYCTAAVLALFLALPATGHWQEWMLFRNSTSFGIEDAQFDTDVGFYVFELPFISYVIDWLFAAMVVVLLLTLAAHLLNGGVLFASSIPSVRAATKAHLAVLLAVLAALKAGDYWLTRYELTNERRGFVQGATYAVVKAQLPALMLLVLIALLTAALFLSTIRTNRWRLPLVASALWLVVLVIGGLIYPAVVQSLVVRPNQADREAPYIERNVIATRQAMGLGDVVVEQVEFGTLTAAEVEADLDPLRDVRLLNPVEMKSRFRVDEGQVAGLTIDDLDVDRYELDGEREEVLIAARELDVGGSANQSWQGRHLVNTRGCGVVLAPVSRVTQTDRPAYQDVELERPELYFSPSLTSYAIARTDEAERDCGDNTVYEGTRGVRMSSFTRRAAFALAFLDYNVVGSGAINGDSQMLWVRDVRDRVRKLAPFLSFDGDPYPVVVGGRVTWVIDAYTSTNKFPYAQRVGNVELTPDAGLSRNANYIRNSVKATVDAYDGSVTFYAVDENDPILRAWRGAFPDMFTPLGEMSDELRAHLRYPEDLFRVQTDLYSKYQLAPENFFQREGAWSVAQAPNVAPRIASSSAVSSSADEEPVSVEFGAESQAARFVPYYTLFRNQTTKQREFVLLRPFVPFSRDDSRTELQAYMTASSSPESYGRLTAYVVRGERPDGPLRVSSQAESEPSISREISLQDNEESGTQVRFGDVQLVPIGDGLVYVRPFYIEIQQQGGQIPIVTEFRFVIVSYNEQAVHAPTLGEALTALFPGFDADIGDRVPDPSDAGAPGEEPAQPAEPGEEAERPPIDGDSTAAELLAEAEAMFVEAESELRRSGDLGAYQERIEEARELIARALDLIEEP